MSIRIRNLTQCTRQQIFPRANFHEARLSLLMLSESLHLALNAFDFAPSMRADVPVIHFAAGETMNANSFGDLFCLATAQTGSESVILCEVCA